MMIDRLYLTSEGGKVQIEQNDHYKFVRSHVMLRSSEASRAFEVNGMLRSADSAQHDNPAPICKDDFLLDEPCPKG